MKILQLLLALLRRIVDFVFQGSLAFKQKKPPFVCGVEDFAIPQSGVSGRVFYPSLSLSSKSQNVNWFSHGISHIIKGKLAFMVNPQSRSSLVSALVHAAFCLAKLIPSALLPGVPNTRENAIPVKEPLPLIVWSHGRGGNVHDHALMLSQIAVEVPAICLCVTHTDGSADTWNNSTNNKPTYFRHSSCSGTAEEFLKESVEMLEYQVQYRCNELKSAIAYLMERPDLNVSNSIVVGGYDLGGATALALAPKVHAVGAVSLDGTFSIYDKFKFPRALFHDDSPISTPTAYLLSDEWDMWNRAVTENTKLLIEKTEKHKHITVKQTKHYNFIECMFWVPQPLVVLLRLADIIHRRGSPRKTYRRTVKWLVALIQQYVENGSPQKPESPLS